MSSYCRFCACSSFYHAFVFLMIRLMPVVSWYSNVTLTSNDGDISVVVFLPQGLKKDQTYYYSSRFDHGSMIGSIERKIRTYTSDGQEKIESHTLYGANMWRAPHNSNWPESGVGLAAEFGVGDDGAFCFYRCGWSEESDVTNGVLGYREAQLGESFLKIGVGELVKGTCPICDSTEDYRFNSPYLFAREPEWKLSQSGEHAIRLEHQAVLKQWGYRLVKEISLVGSVLSVTNTLTNLGSQAFSTAWYSHNLFTCDSVAVGPGYSIDLDLKGKGRKIYDEPASFFWSYPLAKFANISPSDSSINVNMVRTLEPGMRIKTEFVNDQATKGGFKLNACQTSITNTIPQLALGQEASGLTMYAYNLYIERETFSPEPQILLKLAPQQSTTWTQQLVIDSYEPSNFSESGGWLVASVVQMGRGDGSMIPVAVGIFLVASLLVLALKGAWRRYRYRDYKVLPDVA